mgnify:CR=1 FL=1
MVAGSKPAPRPCSQATDADAADDERDEAARRAPPSAVTISDAEPRWRVGHVVPAFLRVDPLRADPHEDPARQRNARGATSTRT